MHRLWPLDNRGPVVLAGAAFLLLLVGLAWFDRRGPSPVWLLAGLAWIVAGELSAKTPGAAWALDPEAYGRYFVLAVGAGLLVAVRGIGVRTAPGLGAIAVLVAVPAMVVGFALPAVTPAVDPVQLRDFQECLMQDRTDCELPIAPVGWVISGDN